MMLRIIAIAAMLLATPAVAAPKLGASDLSASNEKSHARAEGGPRSVFAVLFDLYNVKLTPPEDLSAAASAEETDAAPTDCDRTEKGVDEKKAEARRRAAAAGPEPVYLAF